MSTDMTVFQQAQRPAYAQAQQAPSALTKSLVGGGGFPGKRISIKGGVFRLIADGKEVGAIEDRHLDVVIVRAAEHIGRTFYAEKFDEDNPAPPACWSADGRTPDKTAASPQAATCAECPQNVKGSGTDDSRACRYSQRLAVLLANDLDGDVMQLSLPATSLFGKEEGDNRPLQAYARQISANNANIEQFITRLKFDLKASNPKLFFKAMRWLTEDEYAIALEKGGSDEAVKCVTMTVSQVDKVPAKPAAPAPAALPPAPAAAQAAPQEASSDEPPPPPPKARGRKSAAAAAPAAPAEPQLRTSTSAPAMPERKSAADVAAAWGADD